MTPEQQRIAIAEACGWKHYPREGWKEREGGPFLSGACMPAYLHDLNAMHEAEKVLTDDPAKNYCNFNLYLQALDYVVCRDKGQQVDDLGWSGYIAFATAAQRAEAFLRTLELWQD